MFGFSFGELVVVCLVILIVFGPEKLPQAARTFGKIMGDLRRTSDGIRREFYHSVYQPTDDFERSLNQEARKLIASQNAARLDDAARAAAPASPTSATSSSIETGAVEGQSASPAPSAPASTASDTDALQEKK